MVSEIRKAKVFTIWRLVLILLFFISIFLSWDYILLIRASYLVDGCATKQEFEQIVDPNLNVNRRTSLSKKIADCIHNKQGYIESFVMKIPIDLEK